MICNIKLILAALFVLLYAQPSCLAETQKLHTPKPCLGYNPELEIWRQAGVFLTYAKDPLNCPTGYAFVGVRRAIGQFTEPRFISVMGDCCPMPEDALTDKHVYEEQSCPAGYVVTGSKVLTKQSPDCDMSKYDCRQLWIRKAVKLIRCTKLNSKRYQLGSANPGIHWGWGIDFSETNQKRITRRKIPAGLRYGLGRFSRIGWSLRGCVGSPWGSMLVEKQSKYCSGHLFSQLEYIGQIGDPPQGTPVQVVAECSEVSDPLDPNAQCIP